MTIGFDVNIFFREPPLSDFGWSPLITTPLLVIKSGTGLHIEAINRDPILIYHDFFLCLWIGELFYTFALAPAKLAFLAFYWRIFGVSSIKRPVQIVATTVMLWSFVRVCISSVSLRLSPSGLMLCRLWWRYVTAPLFSLTGIKRSQGNARLTIRNISLVRWSLIYSWTWQFLYCQHHI